MARITSGNYDALAWVQDEIQKSLADALQALTRYIDLPDDHAALADCISQTHQINGTLEMLGFQGAQLLASEMLSSAIAIRDLKTLEVSQAQDNLLKGHFILANYLKLIGSKLQDHPLRLINIVNELRETRGEPELNELDLFKPSLLVKLPDEISPNPANGKPSLGISTTKLSHVFQISLLNWLKQDDMASLVRMASILRYLRLSSIQERSIILWWTAEGVIEAILNDDMPATPEMKIRIGKVNQTIKLFTNQDEAQFLSVFPTELVHSLLLLVARSTTNGNHVNSLKKAFYLDFFNAQQQQQIYSFTDNAESEVNTLLLQQLQEIKEHSDRVALSDHYSPEIMQTLIEQLSSISSTFQLLDKADLSTLLQQQAQQIQQLADQQKSPNNEQMMVLANDLLHIENLLQSNNNSPDDSSSQLQQTVITECLHDLINVKETLSSLLDDPERSSESLSTVASQLELIAGSLSMLNLDRATALLESTAHKIVLEKQVTSKELNLFAEIIAAFEFYMDNLLQRGLEQSQLLEDAQNILDRIWPIKSDNHGTSDSRLTIEKSMLSLVTETAVQSYINQHITLENKAASTTENSVSSLETTVQRYINQHITLENKTASSTENVIYPLETTVQRYINQHITLENKAASSTENVIYPLETSVQRYINQHITLENKAASTTENGVYPLETTVQRYINQHITLENKAASTTENVVYPLETTVQSYINSQSRLIDPTNTQDISPSFAEGIDAEIAEIFIEEANEVLAELGLLIPERSAEADTVALTIIRRHFHTLKGSGYMAGANVIADMAKAVEYLLNTILENSLAISEELSPLISDCAELIPDLLKLFAQGEMGSNQRAKDLTQAAGHLLETETETETETENILSEQDELQQIFNLEATQHIATFKQALNQSTSSFTINKELLRAAHSLKGCAGIAQVLPVAELATCLDHSLRKRYELAATLNEQQRELLSSAIEGLDCYVEYIKSPEKNAQPNLSPFIDSLHQLLPTDDEKSAQHQLIDPEFLVVFIEETDELLSQYEHQIQQFNQQANNSEINASLKQILETLRDNAETLNLDTMSELYQLLIQLAQQANADNSDHLMLFELGSEEINLQVESLLQNKPSPSIDDFRQKLETNLAQILEGPVVTGDELFLVPNEDPELLDAFTEECAELLTSSGDAIKNWINGQETQNATAQLQRNLHTIKGGARLAGITPIADLTHQIESLVFKTTESDIKPSATFFDLLQRSQDRLADMQELLANNSRFNFAHDLINEINAFSNQTAPVSVGQLPADLTTKAISSVDSNAGMPTQYSHSDQIRVRADLLDFLSNFAGEVSISRDRVGQQNSAIKQQLSEMEGTLSRLQDQLRNLEIETETQILFRYDDEALKQESEFDPLELDRFSMIQQLSRGLTETVNDMHEISQSLEHIVQESDDILLQQSRLSTDLQQALMNTRLIPFEGLVPRFERIVRQTNAELGKQSELIIHGADREFDRTLIDRIVAPIEHILRNAIAHGIESADQRLALGKSAVGTLTMTISQEGSEVLIALSDDGQGINIEKVRQKALAQNLITHQNMPGDEELIQFILSTGFSTADNVSQLAGRGVGMDVVSNEIHALKGRLSIQTISGKSTTFNIRLPLTLSIMQALLVSSHEHQYAIPLAAVDAGARISVAEVRQQLTHKDESSYQVNGEYYRFLPLSTLLDLPLVLPDDPKLQLPLLLFRYGDMHIALLVDAINSNREIVLKSAGEQFSHIAAITGATILGDGQVVFILDIPTLVETANIGINSDDENKLGLTAKELPTDHTSIAMVVDDSITMRKASGNLLKRHGFDVITARDGVDAFAKLSEQLPDIILLDVEMPRMDGFEFATLIRNNKHYKHIPIIMITSRTGSKHRDRGMEIGVNAYMGKPYQELELVATMKDLLGTLYPHSDH